MKIKKGTIEQRFLPAEEMRVIRSADEPPKVAGYVATFNKWSEDLGGFREQVRPGAFTKSIAKDDIRSLFNHDPNYVIGRTKADTLTLEEDAKGLKFEAVPPDTQWARDLMVSIDRGDISGCSFSFRTIKDDWNENMTERALIECQVADGGPVTFPAYPSTSVSVRALARAGINTDTLNDIFEKVDAGDELTDDDREYVQTAAAKLDSLAPVLEVPIEGEQDPSVDLSDIAKQRLEIESQL